MSGTGQGRSGQGRTRVLAGGALVAVALGAGAGLLPSGAFAAETNGGTFSQAAQSTVAAKSSDISLAVTTKAAGQTVKITGSGAFDYSKNAGNLDLKVGVLNQSLPITERVVNGKVYISLPAQYRSVFGVKKKWIETSISTTGSTSGLGGENPTSALALLQASASGITKVGPATIDGVKTTEYKANVDPNKAIANEPPAVKKITKGALSQFSGVNSLPITVWIDGQNRVRRITETLSLNPAGSSQPAGSAGTDSVEVSSTVNLSNFGVHVSVAAPPAGQVSHKSLSQLSGGSI